MAYQPVDIGSAPNDGTGDPIRDAFDKCNDNFVELYAGLTGLLDFKGSTDCSANPNYPAASKGDFYVVSVAGKIGGASGTTVEVGDAFFAEADNAGGTQAAVGTDWSVIQANIVGSTIAELDDIPDVNAPTPADGDVLTWDSTPGEWVAAAPTAGSSTIVFGIEIDGGGSAITTGVKGFIRIAAAHTITKATALSTDAASTSCSITVDVWRDSYANYPPTSGDKISASAPVTLSSATKSEDSTLTGWSTSGSAGDVYGFSVASVTSALKVLIEIEATV